LAIPEIQFETWFQHQHEQWIECACAEGVNLTFLQLWYLSSHIGWARSRHKPYPATQFAVTLWGPHTSFAHSLHKPLIQSSWDREWRSELNSGFVLPWEKTGWK
jgi:hypothetical protein